MQILITEVRTVVYEPDMAHYAEDDRTVEGVVRTEKKNAEEFGAEYMDCHGADSVITFEVIED